MKPCRFIQLILCVLLLAMPAFAQDQPKVEKEKQAASQKAKQEKKSAAKKPQPQQEESKDLNVLRGLKMKDICGKDIDLDKYQGKVILVVNVASKCGFTGQYKPLQAIHSEFSKHGFEVVAFPCNQFGKQEPAKDPVINNFCKEKFGIKFDMFSKVDVNGKNQAELFKRLTNFDLAPAGKGKVHWNFEKFLVGKDGKPCARFRSNVSPDDKVVVTKIKEALGIKEEKKKDPKDDAGKEKADKKPAEKKPADTKKPAVESSGKKK